MPLPNPPFVFPARDAPSSSAPSSYSRTTGRRPFSAIELSASGLDDEAMTKGEMSRSIPAVLPTFSFNPAGAVDPETGRASPATPPPSLPSRNIPSRHRRGTSEFIGGRSGSGMSLISTSPAKSENASDPPNPSTRRGHAHRRSAAFSAHDLSIILNPSSTSLGGSAPTSPSEAAHRHPPFAHFIESDSQPASRDNVQCEASSRATNLETRHLYQLNRARVGFSENIEIIPRPVSLVSSESSSTPTVQGHSVSGSPLLTSTVSGETSSPLLREKRATSGRVVDARPKTAGPRLDDSRDQFAQPRQPPELSTKKLQFLARGSCAHNTDEIPEQKMGLLWP